MCPHLEVQKTKDFISIEIDQICIIIRIYKFCYVSYNIYELVINHDNNLHKELQQSLRAFEIYII